MRSLLPADMRLPLLSLGNGDVCAGGEKQTLPNPMGKDLATVTSCGLIQVSGLAWLLQPVVEAKLLRPMPQMPLLSPRPRSTLALPSACDRGERQFNERILCGSLGQHQFSSSGCCTGCSQSTSDAARVEWCPDDPNTSQPSSIPPAPPSPPPPSPPPLPTVHFLMIPLVMATLYEVTGRVEAQGLLGHHVTADLRVHLHNVGAGSARKGRAPPRSRWMRLSFGHESAIRDRHGTPHMHSILRYPMLLEQEDSGMIRRVLRHPDDPAEGASLKRMLAGSLQLARVSAHHLPANDTAEFSQAEEDHSGPARASYSVRRGLVGRLVYQKALEYQPTLRRPPVIVQTVDVSALVHHRTGTIVRLRSAINLQPNASASPGETLPNHVHGSELIPKQPVVMTWRLQTEEHARASSRRRLLDAQSRRAAPQRSKRPP